MRKTEESFFCDERSLHARGFLNFFERREIDKSQGETQHTAQNGEVLLKIAREKRQENAIEIDEF